MTGPRHLLVSATLALALAYSTVQAFAREPVLPFEPDTLKQIIASQHGQSFWLILWDLDCPYCMVSLRLLAERQRSDPQLRVLTVATDSIDEADAVATRLQEIGMRGRRWAFGEAAPEALRYAIDPTWRGEKPRAYYYDAHGKRKVHVGVLRSADLSP
jgi:hypothetical protein